MNVSENTINILYQLIKQCFDENRWFDRAVSVLGVKFAMNNTADLIHHGIAHMFPQLSDEIGEKCLERYNIDVKYGETSSGVEDYSSIDEIISKVEERIVAFQNMLIVSCQEIQNNGDIQVYADLLDILEDYNKYVEQAILLKDKAKLYNGNWASYDKHIKFGFWILGE